MPRLFSRKGKDGQGKHKSKKDADVDLSHQLPAKPRWVDAYARTTVEPHEVQELVKRCTCELKARALDLPFLLLPFRPTSDPSAVRSFIRHFFGSNGTMKGAQLAQELLMTEPMVVAGVLKWCWSRIHGGIVGWDAYRLFQVGERDSSMARDAFSTFIPLSVEDQARSHIIFDFFDLLSAVAAHGKTNGFGGRKLSRMAAWWAFEVKESSNGFDGGYKAWLAAADASSHLFFAYLRSLAPQRTLGGISMLPTSLQKLLQETEYPPEKPSLLQFSTNRVVMIVDTVSPTPFALLRRSSHFQYRDTDRTLQELSSYEDPVKALTEECRRVLKAISHANQSQVSSLAHSTSLRDASWSRFEDIGFSGSLHDQDDEDSIAKKPAQQLGAPIGLRTTPASGGAPAARPATPSWADFLSSGFVDESPGSASNVLLPPDKALPPIDAEPRQKSAQSHEARLENNRLRPGELASITRFDLDDSFWWVWMSSLAPEESAERKSAFGRCAVVETIIRSGRWLVMEEMVQGAAPEPEAGAYLAEKKSLFSWTRRGKSAVSRTKSTAVKAGPDPKHPSNGHTPPGVPAGKPSIGPDQHARIHAAAQKLQAKQAYETQTDAAAPTRRGRSDAEVMREKTNSVLTLQPVIASEASPAMKWAKKYDKDAIREAYLANNSSGRGLGQPPMSLLMASNGHLESMSGYVDENYRPDVPAKSLSTPVSPMDRERTASSSGHDMTKTERTESPLPPLLQERDRSVEKNGREDVHASDAAVVGLVDKQAKQHRQPKKLHRDEKKAGSFLKFFSRNKYRQSRLPDQAANDVGGGPDVKRLATTPAPPVSPVELRTEPESSEQVDTSCNPTEATARAFETASAEGPEEDVARSVSPVASETTEQQVYEPTGDDNLFRANIADAEEAHHEFSRFDQGPLQEQPAFVPDVDSDDDAGPPPVSRQSSNTELVSETANVEEAAVSPVVPVQDRWAQIRKNAAERARQSEEQGRGDHSKPGEKGEGMGVGVGVGVEVEETIESRVARIKARVAELTGNVEGGPTVIPSARRPAARS